MEFASNLEKDDYVQSIFAKKRYWQDWPMVTNVNLGKEEKILIVVRFVIGQRGYRVENRFIDADVAPFIFQGRTFMPVRFLADSLGATTRWDGATRTVTIT